MIPNESAIYKSAPSRREFMHLGSAGLGLMILSDRTDAIEQNQNNLIDAHSHIWTPDTKSYPLATGFQKSDMQPASFTPDELMAHAKASGVGRVVLIQMSFYGNDNSYMLAMMKKHAGVFSGVAVVDENESPAKRMKALAKLGVRGFRIRPHGRKPQDWLRGGGMKKMWRCGADENLAMCHLINPEFLPSVERMCRAYPRTPVVIDHFARIGIDGMIRDSDVTNLCRLSKFPQVTIKVSAYYALGKKAIPYAELGPMIRRLRDAFGAERLMWASDCPYQVQGKHTYKASIDLIKNGLEFLSASDKKWILQKTAERVFF